MEKVTMKLGIYKQCLKCNKEFYVYRYLINQGVKKEYCSQECRTNYDPKECLICKKILFKNPREGRDYWESRKYCSTKCSGKGYTPHVEYLGKYAQKGAPAPLKAFKSGKRAFQGTLAEYKRLHYKIGLRLGKPNKCTQCGKIATGRQIDWANKSGEYREDPDDWIRLCKKCHWEYDKQFLRMESP